MGSSARKSGVEEPSERSRPPSGLSRSDATEPLSDIKASLTVEGVEVCSEYGSHACMLTERYPSGGASHPAGGTRTTCLGVLARMRNV